MSKASSNDTKLGGDAFSAKATITERLAEISRQVASNERVFVALILALIYVLAFCTRLFSVLRFESVIHEFDPYFNYRTTRYLVEEGAYAFHNFFDSASW